MLCDSERFYLPNLHTFQNENVFYGSFGDLRFRVRSEKRTPEDGGEEQWGMATLSWLGEYCLEESEVLAEAWFPMTEAGYQQVLDWLDGEYVRLCPAQQADAPQQPQQRNSGV